MLAPDTTLRLTRDTAPPPPQPVDEHVAALAADAPGPAAPDPVSVATATWPDAWAAPSPAPEPRLPTRPASVRRRRSRSAGVPEWVKVAGVVAAAAVTIVGTRALLSTSSSDSEPLLVDAGSADPMRSSSVAPGIAVGTTELPRSAVSTNVPATALPGPPIASSQPATTGGATQGTAPVATPPEATVPTPGPLPPEPPPAAPLEISTSFAGSANDEWVTITNVGDDSIDLTGWSVRDDGLQHLYVFGEVALAPGSSIMLRSGCGTDIETERFWCAPNPDVWNDTGDAMLLLDAAGNPIALQRG